MSIFNIDDIKVVFPYPTPYPEQIDYMTQLKLSLDANGPCVLEMPSGTGKTVCLLSLIIAYMSQRDNVGPLIYCTRTIPELSQGVEELKRVNETRRKLDSTVFDENFLGISLSSRYNLCINAEASEQPTKKDVDIACRALTIKYAEKRCDFFDHIMLKPRPGVYSLSDLKEFGVLNGMCPYFLSRRLVKEANVIFCSYAYALDPGASDILLKYVTPASILVFDEAHNIDDVCCEYMSMFLDQMTLDKSAIAINNAQKMCNEIIAKEQKKLQEAFEKLKNQLREEDGDFVAHETLEILSHPALPEHIMKKSMPSSLRNFDEFIDIGRKMVQFFSAFVQGIEKPKDDNDVLAYINTLREQNPDLLVVDAQTDRYLPSIVLSLLKKRTGIDKELLHFLPIRLGKFLTHNKVDNFEQYIPLIQVMSFAGLLGTYEEGFEVFVEQSQEGPLLQMTCLDSSLAFKSALHHFRRVVITSGTLSPLSIYPRLLGFEPTTLVDFTMSITRRCLLPMIVSKGQMQLPLSSSFKLRDDPRVARAYGDLLLQYAKIVPDGIVGFFPSYVYLNYLIKEWMNNDILEEVMKYKLIFVETESPDETSIALSNYRNSCDCGRGAILLGVARGRVSEGIDFSDHYGRCCILFGMPVRNTQSVVVQARAEYVEKKHGIPRTEFILFDAMRAASQCVGRLLRSKKDYGVVVLADRRYSKPSSHTQLPHWIKDFMDENSSKGISVDASLNQTREFLIEMAQPFILDLSKLK